MKKVILGTNYDAGKPGADTVLDLEALIGSHACIIANSGGGKSGLIRRLLETTNGQVLQIVLDAEDEFYTLREKFPAYVIAGGEGGDVPISTATAATLALAALENNLSLIVQLNDLSDREAFVGAFLTALVNAPSKLWRPALVVIDEAHRFAPEGVTSASSLGVKALLERGRKRGFTAVLASQRMAKIAKSITAEVNNWFLGRVGQSTDRDRAADALGFKPSSTEARGLQSLPPRTFWTFGPASSPVPVQFRVGDVATTIIRAGQSKLPTPPAPAALEKILKELAAAVPKEEPAAASSAQPANDPRVPELLERVRIAEGTVEDLQNYLGNCGGDLVLLSADLHSLSKRANEMGAEMQGKVVAAVPTEPLPVEVATPPPPKPAARPQTGSGGMKPAHQRVLDSLAWWRKIGFDPVERDRAAVVAGFSPKASTFGVYVAELAKRGLVYSVPGQVGLMPEGLTIAHTPAAATIAELRSHARGLLKPQEQRVFDVVYQAWPKEISRDQVAREVGLSPNASTCGVYLGAVASFGMIEPASRGHVRAADWLFPNRRK